MEIRPAAARGCSCSSGIHARFSFDFGEWTSPLGASFGALRVLNEDRIGGGRGFATHGHSDYEIISLVLAGTVRHVDSLTGRATRCSRGEVQYTCAGTGIEHSEHNDDDDGDGGGGGDSDTDGRELHLMQVWLRPHTLRLPPRYEVRAFRDWAAGDTGGALRLLLSAEGARGSIRMSADASVLVGAWPPPPPPPPPPAAAAAPAPALVAEWQLEAGRSAYVHLIAGSARVSLTAAAGGDELAVVTLGTGDAVAVAASDGGKGGGGSDGGGGGGTSDAAVAHSGAGVARVLRIAPAVGARPAATEVLVFDLGSTEQHWQALSVEQKFAAFLAAHEAQRSSLVRDL